MIKAKTHIICHMSAMVLIVFTLVIIALLEPMKGWVAYCTKHYVRNLPRNYAESLVILPFLLLGWGALLRISKRIPVRCNKEDCPGKAYLVDDWRGMYVCSTCDLEFPGLVMKKW
jgi:hypothetical protein